MAIYLTELAETEERAKVAFADFQAELARGAPLNSPRTIWQAIDLLTKRAEYAEAALANLTSRLGEVMEGLSRIADRLPDGEGPT